MKLACSSIVRNLSNIDKDCVKVGILAERSGCYCYADFRRGRRSMLGDKISVTPAEGNDGLVMKEEGGVTWYLVPGRQILTAEGIEVLALTVDLRLPDRLQAKDVINAILDFGGVPVLSWAPGKWFFGRGRVVRDLLESSVPGRVLIGDTALRPTIWAEPLLMKRAAANGFGVVAGSDPLPFAGEETRLGSYASVFEGDFDIENPGASMRDLLIAAKGSGKRVGGRCGPVAVIMRLIKNARLKKVSA